MTAWLLIAGGVVLLYAGAELLVKGATGLALSFRISPIVIGLTVVAYGTSAPELVVGVTAALEGRGTLTLANSIGSNIANLGLILGLTALIAPPRVQGGLVWREIPFLLASAIAVPLVLRDGNVSRFEGLALLFASLVYTAWMLRRRPVEAAVMTEDAEPSSPHSRWALALLAAAGLALLLGGGKLLVDGAVRIAVSFGLSQRIIGLTIVAIGTSLPELAASVVAALRGHSAIAVGNVIGSNIFNVFLIIGAAAALEPIDAAIAPMGLDLLFLLGMTIVTAVMIRTERRIGRPEGIALIAGYASFLGFLVMAG